MIICLSHSQDFYTIDLVMESLRASGTDAYRFNTDTFSHELRFRYHPDNGKPSFHIEADGRSFHSSDITAVWYRKMWDIRAPESLDTAYRHMFYQEYNTMRDLLFDSLGNVPWMNPMRQDHLIGGNKAIQLELAQQSGLDIPLSLFTNDAAAVRDFFYHGCAGQMITKLHGSLSRSMSGNTPFFPTTRVTEADLDRLDSLAFCPMIFQELIPKAYELRIAYVDGIFFAGKIDATASQRGPTDWRVASDIPFHWQAYELPGRIQEQLHRMMQDMGLVFGAIDMMRHTDGRYIFLEVNPQGEWGMLQHDLAYPIAQTIAAKLAARQGRQPANAIETIKQRS